MVIMLFHFNCLTAQNYFGVVLDNYSGVNSLQANPAGICYQPFKFDINILGVDAYINNNNFYTDATNTVKLLFSSSLNKLVLKNNKYNPDAANVGDFTLNADIKPNGYAFGGLTINGPSVLYAITKKKSVAFSINYRNAFNITQLLPLTAKILFEGPSYNSLRNQKYDFLNAKFSFANWIETGISYAQVVGRDKKYVQKLGGSFKVLWGLNGGYIFDNGFNGDNTNGRDLILKNSSFNYAYAGPNNDKKTVSSDINALRGMGASIDFGYIIQRKNNQNLIACPDMYKINEETTNYRWKAGVSLLDFGAINFNQSAFSTAVSNANLNWYKYDTIFKQDLFKIDSVFKSYLGSNQVKSSNNFWMILPAAFSIQFDYKLNDIFFLNTTFIQRLTPAKLGSLSRMNTIVFSPRFETPNLSFNLPISLIEYKDVNFGAAIRYKYLTIGSDRIAETLGFQTVYGANVYLLLKFNILSKSGKSSF